LYNLPFSKKTYYITRRNCKMKRILSLVLVLVLVLGSVPVAFAAEDTAGDMLKTAGFVAGDQNGNLNEDQKLTREQMMVLIAEMNGVKEEAATFGIPADFSDVNENDWFAPYVWYAFYQGWTTGMGDGTFGAGLSVDSKMAATFMLKALGYEVADYNASVAQAAEVGIEVEETSAMTRGEGFDAMWSTVNLPKQGSEVALGVELGKIEAPVEETPAVTAAVDSAEALSNTFVEVEFDADLEGASAADFSIVEKNDASAELAVVEVAEVDGDTVLLETAAMDEGTAYTVIVGESSTSFTGIAKVTSAPEVDSVTGTDEGQVTVEFDMNVDAAAATDITNYSINKEGTVVGAEMDGRDTVLLTVEGFETKTSKKLTVENVVSLDGVKMSKSTKTFSPDFDTDAPDLDMVTASPYNNTEVIVDFDDDHGIDKATAEDIANYSIDGLEILAAKATYQTSDDDDYYNRVILTTSEQTKSTKYDLTVKYMVDGSTAMNATDDEQTEDFRAGSEDESEPSVVGTPDFVNMTEIEIVFSEENALDSVTALDLSNYSFEDDELEVVDIAFDDEDDNAVDYDDEDGSQQDFDAHDEQITLVLTVKGAEEGEKYELNISGVADVFGNEMDDDSFKVKIDAEIKAATPIDTVNTVDLETIEVVFEDASNYGEVTSATAEDPTNYVIDGLGAAIEADLDGETVTLTVPEMTAGKTYTITVNGVENKWGYTAEDLEKTFIATADSNDEDAPTVEDVDYSDQGKLEVTFSEVMDDSGLSSKTVTVENEDGDSFTLVAYKVDEDVIYFNATTANDNDADGEEFAIMSFSDDVTDLAGNIVDYDTAATFDDADETFDTDDEFTAADDALEVSSMYQENGREIYVYFDAEINSDVDGSTIASLTDDPTDSDDSASDYASATTFDISTDSDDETLIILTLQSGTFDDDEETYLFNFATVVEDELERAVMVEYVDLDVEYDDDDAPEIEEVKVIDNETIKVYFNEPLRTDGSWTLSHDDDSNVQMNSDSFSIGDDVIEFTVTEEELDSDTDYTLTVDNAPKDLAGNDYEEEGDEWVFSGTEVEPDTDDVYFFVKNATKAEVSMEGGFGYTQAEGDAVISGNDFDLYVGSTELVDGTQYEVTYDADSEKFIVYLVADETDLESALTFLFDDSASFKAVVDGDTSQAANGILDFDSVEAAEVTTTASSTNTVMVVPFDGYDDDNYDNEVFEVYTVASNVYTEVTQTVAGSVDDNEVTFTIATTDYADATKYVFVVRDENGLVIAATDELTGSDMNDDN
jgi:hypothetical protein